LTDHNLARKLSLSLGAGGLLMDEKQETLRKKMTFTQFSESCRFKYLTTQTNPRDHEGNILLDDPKVQKQLKLHKVALDR
jgi:pterin-4a-carbinolamine dehydratase